MSLNNRRELGRFSKENRNVSQEINDHPGEENIHMHTKETKDCNLVLSGNKLALVRGYR
jgi:hypothetical protein